MKTNRAQSRKEAEAVSYAIGHGIRIEVLCLLNEGVYSTAELAEQTRWPLTRISHHIKEMLRSGSIEVARVQKVRNTEQYFYRAVELPIVTDEEAAALSSEVKQEYATVVLQSVMAELLAALRAERLNRDPRVHMMWSWHNVDEIGRSEIADEQRESWERIMDIVARSTNRRARTGETGTTLVTATFGFERSRKVPADLAAARRFTPSKY